MGRCQGVKSWQSGSVVSWAVGAVRQNVGNDIELKDKESADGSVFCCVLVVDWLQILEASSARRTWCIA